MTSDEWFDTYQPVENADGDSGLTIDGRCYFFETFGKDLATVLAVVRETPAKVWTLIEDDEGELHIVDGYRIVNRLGHFITQKPFSGERIRIAYID